MSYSLNGDTVIQTGEDYLSGVDAIAGVAYIYKKRSGACILIK